MLLQYQGYRSPQACHVAFRRANAWRFAEENSRFDFVFDDWPETGPLRGEVADYHNLRWCESRDQHAHPTADRVGHLLERFDSMLVVFVRARQQLLEGDSLLAPGG